jgi:hypothetical protein
MYLYKIPVEKDQQPEWFRARLRKIIAPLDRSWVWNWNDTYDRKITIREGHIHIVFENEQDYMWFILKEL